MTIEDLEALFEKYEDEFLEFDKVEAPLSRRADLAAFMLLDRLAPGRHDIVSGAKHDEIWLEIGPETLARVASEADVLTLIRCGVRYDSEVDSLAMFV